jgi:hypothetical protein
MNNLELTFMLTVDEANTILSALGKLPYELSANIIAKLQLQAQPQLNASDGASALTTK